MIRILSNLLQPIAKRLEFSINHAFKWRHFQMGGTKKGNKGGIHLKYDFDTPLVYFIYYF